MMRIIPRTVIARTPMSQQSFAERAARSGRLAPRYWPVKVLAGTEKAATDRKEIASQRIATPCAAVAMGPSLLIRLRNQSWPMMFAMLSPAAGMLILRILRITDSEGRHPLTRIFKPEHPRINKASTMSPAVVSLAEVPIAIPLSPSAGIGPSPCTSDQERTMFMTLKKIMSHIPVFVSPAP